MGLDLETYNIEIPRPNLTGHTPGNVFLSRRKALQLSQILYVFITARKRSLGQGNIIFSEVCVKNSVHGGGMSDPGGAWSWGDAWPVGAAWSWGGVETPSRDGYCCGRYASYWNAYLLKINLTVNTEVPNEN